MEKTTTTVPIILSLIAQLRRAERRHQLAKKLYQNDYEAKRFTPRISRERWDAAERAVADAEQGLEQLLMDVEWGPQYHGRVFVTRRSGWPSNSNTYVTVCVDGLPVVSGEIRWDRETGSEYVWNLKVHDQAAEREAREAARADARRRSADQALVRERIARDLAAGRVPAVEATDGQRGGYLTVRAPSHLLPAGCAEGMTLAISGVLKAAGITPGDHPYETWSAQIADLQDGSDEPTVRVRPRQLPPRVRYMRAAEVRS